MTMPDFFNAHGSKPKIKAFYSNLDGRITHAPLTPGRKEIEMKATYQTHWKNGDGGIVSSYQLDPPYRGHAVVHVAAFRSVTRRMVTQVCSPEGVGLSDCIDGSSSHKGALASIGYD